MKKGIQQKGFTLVELLVTLTVLIVTLAIGIPFYDNMIANNRAIALSNDFIRTFNLAKSEAVTRGSFAGICANGGTDSSPSCGSDWTNGWFVYEDANWDASYDSASSAGETVIKIWQALEPGIYVDMAPSSATAIMFTSTGQKFSSGDLVVKMAQIDGDGKIATTGKQIRCMYMNSVGQINIIKIAGTKGSLPTTASCP